MRAERALAAYRCALMPLPADSDVVDRVEVGSGDAEAEVRAFVSSLGVRGDPVTSLNAGLV